MWGLLFIKRLVDLEMIKHVIPLMFLIGLSYSQGGGDALDFDGSDDYVEVSHNSAFSLISKKIFIFSYV